MRWFYRFGCAGLLTCLFFAACDDGPTKPRHDRTAPQAIVDMAAEAVSPTIVRLTWTSTGDDGVSGRAYAYDIRCSASPIIDSATWEGATSCEGEPEPQQAGELETYVYTSLLPESQYYFCVRVGDESGNWSGLSNLDSALMMPLFADPIRVGTPNAAEKFRVADVDRDGDSDVVKFDFWEGFGILLNDGSGNLISLPEIYFSRKLVAGDVGDLDGDGYPDFAAVSYNLDSVIIFTHFVPGVIAVDTSWHVDSGPYGIKMADLDGDGDKDLAVILESNMLQIYSNTGSGQFSLTDSAMTGTSPYKIAISDIDRDGDMDIAVPNYYGYSVSVYLNDGLGNFSERQRATCGQCPEGIAIADINGDLVPDIAVSNRFVQTATVLYGVGDGTFVAGDTCDATGMCRALAAGDLDGDGDNDLALANETVYGVTLLLNLGGYSGFAAPQQMEEENWCFDVAIVDMDGDSDLDIVTGHRTISVYLNNTVMADAVSARAIAQK